MILEKKVDPDDLPEEPWRNGQLLWYLYRRKDWSQRTIAYELDCDKEHVLKGLIQNNVLRPWTDKEALQKALDDHETPAGIAEAWNCSELTIRRWLEKHELKKRADLTEDLLREMDVDQRLTAEEIANDLGYASVEVQIALREHGINRWDGARRFE